MIALTAVIHNPVMKGLYIKHLQSGKSKMASLGVCMHKILRAIFGMLKHDTVYNPQIDKINQQRFRLQKNAKRKKDEKRRYQKRTNDAPISRRQTTLRKKRRSSQNQTLAKCEIKPPLPSYLG